MQLMEPKNYSWTKGLRVSHYPAIEVASSNKRVYVWDVAAEKAQCSFPVSHQLSQKLETKKLMDKLFNIRMFLYGIQMLHT